MKFAAKFTIDVVVAMLTVVVVLTMVIVATALEVIATAGGSSPTPLFRFFDPIKDL